MANVLEQIVGAEGDMCSLSEARVLIADARESDGSDRRSMLSIFPPIIAEAAAALERHAPHAVWRSHPSSSQDWLNENRPEAAYMTRSVARAIRRSRQEGVPPPSVEQMLVQIVSDVVIQMDASRALKEAALPDLLQEDGLRSDTPIGKSASRVPMSMDGFEVMMLRHESSGAYSRLPAPRRRKIASDLLTGRNLPASLREHLLARAAPRDPGAHSMQGIDLQRSGNLIAQASSLEAGGAAVAKGREREVASLLPRTGIER